MNNVGIQATCFCSAQARAPADPPAPAAGNGEEQEMAIPVVMHPKDMPRSEREKVRRICTPKSTTGRLEVPKGILQMWNTDEGREKLLSMWCKSGAVKAGLKV